ncbi:MAG: chemotaxis protein CheA [Deltaproteobacteria bacterium]|nr:chemotaxis protein CheA [Deltaproteobacteria bacterium]
MSDDLDLKELYGEFVDESQELIETTAKELVTLEKNPTDEELIKKVFRSMHTLKGNAGFIGLTELSDLAHKMENILGKLRDKEISYFPEINDTFFRGLDMARGVLADFIKGVEVTRDTSSLFDEIDALASGAPVPSQESSDEEFLNDTDGGTNRRKDVRRARGRRKAEAIESSYMRVSTGRLDKLVNLVGELAAGRSRLLQLKSEIQNKAFEDVTSFIASISSQIQSEVLSIRMVPIKQLFNKFYRLARDISRPLLKEVELKIIGEETELDKTIIEVLNDPLLHMVRNAISHGLESTEERKLAGKPEVGTVILKAYHEHNHVYVVVEDDGKGLNPETLREVAVKKGVITEEEAKLLDDKESINLIFHSGFSTSKVVDDLSGRGVGMDVVKTNIEKLGGNVEVAYKVGSWTRFTIKMPLTLAIVQLFLLKEGPTTYGIPLNYVDETLRIKTEDIESIKGQFVYMLRGQAIPILGLSEVLGMEKEENQDKFYSVILVRLLQKRVGFIVDDFLGKVETVIKPLGKYIDALPERVEGVSGASILGTGEIVIVLDVPGIFNVIEA